MDRFTKVTNPRYYAFSSNEDAYNESQCRDDIKDGDVLVTPIAVAILVQAWPVLVSGDRGDCLHLLKTGGIGNVTSWDDLDGGKYVESKKLADWFTNQSRVIAPEFKNVSLREAIDFGLGEHKESDNG